jgi:hypothetical protein
MVQVMDAREAREKNRRPAREGFNTLYMGLNRYHRTAETVEPDPNALYPVAFLVEKEPGSVIHPHFHVTEQFQVVVGGSCTFGIHEVDGVAVHYTGPFSSYGPITAKENGLAFFTLRNGFDQGAQYMPEKRLSLREGRQRWQHREATAEVPVLASADELAALAAPRSDTIIELSADGLGSWRHRLPPGASVTGPDPATGGGQFWLVLAGSLVVTDPAPLVPRSCVFVTPDDATVRPVAGPEGADVICMQFPVRPKH